MRKINFSVSLQKAQGFPWIKALAAQFLWMALLFICGVAASSFAEQPQAAGSAAEVLPPVVPQEASSKEQQSAVVENIAASENVTLDFKEADIRNVLKIISYKAGVNIVTSPEVIGNVSIRLVDVPWEKALDVILKTYGFGYEKQGNIITVAPIDKLTAQKKQEVELAQVQPTVTEVFNLKYIDAMDAKKALEPQLSPRGRITVLEMTGQAGWEFGGSEMGKRKRVNEEKMTRSKVLIVSDIPPALDKLREVIGQIDIIPQQVIIETRIMEVSRDKLKDIGFDWGTGQDGATSTTLSPVPVKTSGGIALSQIAGHVLGTQVTPSVFSPLASSISPDNTGLKVLFQKLTGTQFEVMLHMLEEDVHTNTLSAPRIMALNNQEAAILVGTRYPILKQDTTSSSSSATVTTVSLDYYQDIGIQLNVVPQIGTNNYINMVVHPAVTSFTQFLGGNNNTIARYPIIDTREAETRILMKDGDTVVIGGLLKDVKSKSRQGVPFLSKIPLIGLLFSRDTTDTGKLDLLVFISAHIVKEGEFTPEEIEKIKKGMEEVPAQKAAKNQKTTKAQQK